tara:strand:+ start:1369 stop:2688 length:1320 start_codon:yes stop_codon:yes gene_type:complete
MNSSSTLSTLLLYYKREDIQNAIVSYAKQKEVAISYKGEGYGKRPDVLKYPAEVLELVQQGATSFHCSEERWINPLTIETGMKPGELNELRAGWDLVLDIDCKELSFSTIAADILIKAIKHHGVKSLSVKFSGNHGFHIGIPFEAFPKLVNGQETKNIFPEGPKKIAIYLMHMIKDPLREALLKKYSIDEIATLTNKKVSECFEGKEFNPLNVVEIDTILLASRHLYRMPYSLNEKSGLISLPINPDKILDFHKASAIPKNVKISKNIFLDTSSTIPGEATKLLVQGLDFKLVEDKIEIEEKKEFEEIEIKTPFEFFPPCMQLLQKGLKDGKKRSVFLTVNFLKKVGWSYEDIEKYLIEWNKKNEEPLREVNILGQIRYHKQNKKNMLPPNCDSKNYYPDIGICKPDNLCSKIKNPVAYVTRKIFAHNASKKPKKTSKS